MGLVIGPAYDSHKTIISIRQVINGVREPLLKWRHGVREVAHDQLLYNAEVSSERAPNLVVNIRRPRDVLTHNFPRP